MGALTFTINAAMAWNGNKVTDHNRQPVSVDLERIETATRMADGSMRKYWVADKHSFSVNWKDVPSIGSKTVDGFWSIADMESFLLNTPGSFTMTLTNGQGQVSTYTVNITDLNKTITKRFATYDRCDFSVKLEEA